MFDDEAVARKTHRRPQRQIPQEPGDRRDNDPHRERDFGSFELEGEKLFWKIDYFDLAAEFGSEDPTDPKKTLRVLTVMLAEEY